MGEEPVLAGVHLVVRDMNTTLTFYRALGVPVPDAVWRTGTGAHHAKLPAGSEVALELDSIELAKSYNAGWRGSGTLISFRMPSREAVDECHGRLAVAGHRSVQEPYDAFWGSRFAIVEDPDGREIGLMSEPDPARRGAPPAV